MSISLHEFSNIWKKKYESEVFEKNEKSEINLICPFY